MSLSDWLRTEETVGEIPAKPDLVPVSVSPNQVYAAATGRLIPMEDIPDAVFASGVMGNAAGIWPTDGVVYSPVDGVTTILNANMPHAVAIASDDGMEILVHVGIDTVEMRDEGFVVWGARDTRVRAGEPLMMLDLDRVRSAGKREIVITIVSNTDDYAKVEVAPPASVKAGDLVMTTTP